MPRFQACACGLRYYDKRAPEDGSSPDKPVVVVCNFCKLPEDKKDGVIGGGMTLRQFHFLQLLAQHRECTPTDKPNEGK